MACLAMDLKSRLDGNTLDLSLSELTSDSLPVKKIATLKKATNLDLSCNRLTTLPDEFCSLVHLVHLELSQNHLIALPPDFGLLVNLQHLDLYKNRLDFLPASFGNLRALRWLDLKDNPLHGDLQKAAGNCLDAKQCEKAALGVVKYMQSIQQTIEMAKQKELKRRQEDEEAIRVAEEEERKLHAAEKKKEKDRLKQERKKQHNATASNRGKMDSAFAGDHERLNGTGDGGSPSKGGRGTGKGDKRGGRTHRENGDASWFSACCSCIWLLLLVFGTCALISAFVFYNVCTSKTHWPMTSKPMLCDKIYYLFATGDFKGAAFDVYLPSNWSALSADTGKKLSYWWAETKAFSAKVYKSTAKTVQEFDWHGYKKGVLQGLNIVFDFIMKAAKQAYALAYQAAMWVVDQVNHLLVHWPEYWTKIKALWGS